MRNFLATTFGRSGSRANIAGVILMMVFVIFIIGCHDVSDAGGRDKYGSGNKPSDSGGLNIDTINKQAVEEWSAGNYQKALRFVTEAYENAKQKEDEEALAKVLNTLGLVYWRLGNNADAMQCYTESAVIAEKRNMQRLLGLTHTNRGLIYKDQQNFKKSFYHNNKAIEIFQKLSSYRDLGIAYNNQGQIYKNLGSVDSAGFCYRLALDYYQKIDFKDGVSATLYNLAGIYLGQGRQQASLNAVRKSLDLGLEIESKVRISEACQKISEIYEFFGFPDSALFYFKKYNDINHQLFMQDQSNKIAQFQAELGAEVKNLQIQNLQKENELAMNRIWFIGITVLVLILAGAIVVSQIQYKKRKLELRLHNAAKILEVKEHELRAYIIDLSRKNSIIAKMQDEITRKTGTDTPKDTEVARLLEQKILTEDDWDTFKAKFKSIYPGFFSRVKHFNAALTEAEERLLVLIYLDLNGKEMAHILGISPQSVRVCKMRLKKKLQDKGIATVEDFLEKLVK